ncbi:MAG: long-chain fatty acid--CoA ligase [Bacteroidales bacterium]|jgi:long-chain acyl-CoA synthetase
MEVNRIFDLLRYSKERFNKNICLSGKKSGKWVSYSIDQYIEIVDQLSYGLMNLGIGRGDKIATISNNRPEWNFVDMAIIQIGAIHVPLYPTLSDSELAYIINEAGIKLIYISSNVLFNKVSALKDQMPSLKYMFCFDQVPNASNYIELRENGEINQKKEELEKVKSEIHPSDIATIIYTSGTTMNPKGVMLTHHNIISNYTSVAPTFVMNETFVGLSYLPLCHVYERMLNYMYQYIGISIYYAESVASIVDNLREVKPDVLTTVPLLLEKIHGSIIAKGAQLTSIKKAIFKWSVDLAEKYRIDGNNSGWYKIKQRVADILVYKKWREALGNKITRIICGGAALQPQLLKVFWAAGLPVYEGYGLTETSPVISNNNLLAYKLGTVGKILDGVEVEIAHDGEVLCKGPNVMKGYYNNPDLTAESIDKDGWFHTGDIGVIENKIFLKITGRKKTMFKTSSGMYISPENIESKIKQSPFISQIMIVGANQNYLSALIVPDFNSLCNWCKQNNIECTSPDEIAKNKQVSEKFFSILDNYNKTAIDTEQILKFKLLNKEWSIESGELTPKMNMKRNFIYDRYKIIIEEFYSG